MDGARGEPRRRGSASCAQGAARPRRHHEPGEARPAQPVRLKRPRRTVWPGVAGRLLVSRVSSISRKLPALEGRKAPPASCPFEFTAGARLSAWALEGEL